MEVYNMTKTITNSNFQETVVNSKTPFLVDFYSKTCGPCRMLAPVLDEISEENTEFEIGKVCVDDEMPLAMEFSVRVVPTMLIYKNGECVERLEGFRNKEELLSVMKKYV